MRGFVWKAIAAARATPGFRENGLYQTLALRDDLNEADRVQTNPNPKPNPTPNPKPKPNPNQADRVQIDKDVPRTMTGHIFFQVGGA